MGAPSFIGNPYIRNSDGGYGYEIIEDTPEEERKKLEKEVYNYNKGVVIHWNRCAYRGYLKLSRKGKIYLSKFAPKELKEYYNLGKEEQLIKGT